MKRALRAATIVCSALATFFNSHDARRGGWVHDVVALRGHPLLNDQRDALGLLGQTSHDYLSPLEPHAEQFHLAYSWRPVSMMTLLLGNLWGPHSTYAHHLLSFALHLATIGALAWLMEPRDKDESFGPWRAIALLSFAVHPALGEAWMWINGRADVQAGLLLALFALLARRDHSRVNALAMAAIALLGALSKETFLITSGAVLLATELDLKGRSGAAARWSAWGFSAVVFGIGWVWATHDAEPLTLTVFPKSDVQYAARIVALGWEALLVPQSRGMRLLEWSVRTPWTPTEIGALAVYLGVGAWMIARRQGALLALWCGAALSLVPYVLLTRGFWLGLDRYMYQPAVMGLMVFGMRSRPSLRIERKLVLAGGIGWVLTTGGVSWLSSYCYRSNVNFGRCMMEARPHEPTGYYVAASGLMESNDIWTDAVLTSATRGALPEGLAHRVAVACMARRLVRHAERVLLRAQLENPGSVQLVLDLVTLRLTQREWSAALRTASRAESMASQRPTLAAQRLAKALAAVPNDGSVPEPEMRSLMALRQRALRRAQNDPASR